MRKKLLSILLVLSLMLALVPAAFAADEVWSSGTCGKDGDGSNITWTLYKSGLLTFTGTGAMRNYKSPVEDGTPSPWAEHSGIQRIEIGEGITSVGNNAFHASEGIESVTLPSTLRSIGKSAFSANGISEIILPDGLETVGEGAFGYCRSLKQIVLPESVKTLGYGAFVWCTALESVMLPSGLTKIDGHTFEHCESLRSITIPEGVKTIGPSAFYWCKALEEAVLPSTLKKIGDSAFCRCGSLAKCPIPSGVTSIGDTAFSDCSSLTEAALPAKLKTLGLSAFSGCGITSIAFPDGISDIPAGVAMNCTSLERVAIPDGVTAIGDGAFSGCVHLREVTIPERVTTIGACAFFDCNSLTCVRIPAAVAEIGEGAFAGCARLRTVEVADGNAAFSVVGGVLMSADHTRLLAYPNGRAGVDYVVPASVTAMDAHAFQGCRLASITLPDGLQVIPEEAFADSAYLVRVWIPLSVKEIDTDVFQKCPELKYVLYEGTEDDWVYIFKPGITGLDSDYLYVEAPRPDDSAADVFCDVDPTSWSYDGIEFCYMMDYMSGVGGAYFSPTTTTTRAQVVQILYNFVGEPEVTGETKFTDLTQDWYKNAVLWAYQNGVVAGTSDTTFEPEKPVTREQIAVMFMEFAAKVLDMHNIGEAADLSAFPDGDQVSSWAREAMADAVALGIINGTKIDNQVFLVPQGSATREQVATILMEFYTSIDNALIDVTTA